MIFSRKLRISSKPPMRFGLRRCLVLLWAACVWLSAAPAIPQLQIAEVVSANRGSIADEENDFSDWIELRNLGNSKRDLQGFGLSDDSSEPFKWRFPGQELDPRESLLVFASGKDRLSATPLSPDGIPGLQLWLKADSMGKGPPDAGITGAGSQVAIWPDQSRSEHHLRQPRVEARPSWVPDGLNGQPTIRFDGKEDYLRLDYTPDLNPESLTLFAIAKKRGGSGFQTILLSRSTEFSGYNLYANPDNRWSLWGGIGSLWKQLRSKRGIALNRPYLLTGAYSRYRAAFHINGQRADIESFPIRRNRSRPLYLGAGAKRSGEPALFFNGDISEVIVYDHRLQQRSRRRIERYMARKYGITLRTWLHTNFKVDADGEPLLLTSPSGNTVDQIWVPSMPPGHSYGRPRQNRQELQFFSSPTPDSENPDEGYPRFAKPPRFSIKAGFYKEPVRVRLLPQTPSAEIRYTLDGSRPTAASPLFSNAIRLETNTVVRARAFHPGTGPSRVVTHSYFVGEGTSLPVISLSTDPAHLWDEESGIYTHFKPSFDGRQWERPVHIEFFESNESFGIGFNAGIRIHGGNITTRFPQKSIRVYTRQEYGRHAVEYPFFPDHPITRFRRLILRNSGQDWMVTHFRDGLMQSLIEELPTLDTQAYRPVNTFINGQYWGIYNLRERTDEDYLASKHRVDPDNVDILENQSLPNQGKPDHYRRLLRFIRNHSVREPKTLSRIGRMMDLQNYINYTASEIYFANTGWPGQNIRYWRLRSPHGKWRWLMFDTDSGFGLKTSPSHDTLGFATATGSDFYGNPDWATFLLRKLLTNAEFRIRFTNRLADLLNTKFRPQRVVERIHQLADRLEPAMPRQIARWREQATEPQGEAVQTMAAWRDEVARLREFAEHRPDHLRQDLVKHFNLSGTSELTTDVTPPQGGSVSVNTLTLDSDSLPWHGTYFQGVPVHLAAQPAPGFKFVRWQGDVKSASASLRLELAKDSQVTAVFEKNTEAAAPSQNSSGLLVSEIMYHPSETEALQFVELYNSGRTPIDLGNARFVDGIELELPDGAVLPGNGFGIVAKGASFNNFARTRAYYGIEWDTTIWGPFEGNLDNGGERVAIASDSRSEIAQGSRPLLHDAVTYSDDAPWPAEQADGGGKSLHRRLFHQPNSEAGNAHKHWVGDSPSPGYSRYLDDDGDSIPSVWEDRHGLDPGSASDGDKDPDKDGLVNRIEYLGGTDPRNKQSGLDIDHLGFRTDPQGPEMLLQVHALPRHDLWLQHRRNLESSASWKGTTFPAKPFDRLIQVVHRPNLPADRHFYRLWLKRPPSNASPGAPQ